MKKITTLFALTLFLFVNIAKSYAIYDPLSVNNNKFGIHILFPEELSEAAALVNSSGGDWGYVTIPIKASDRNLEKWQTFMDNSRKYRLIPIIRIATEGDYFEKASWSKPTNYDVLDFANFLNSLNWPTKNRYVIIYNEQNRGDEWGGIPNSAEYAQILDYAVSTFKEKSEDFFIISGGLDNASVNVTDKFINQFTYMRQMEDAVPGIFKKIDGIASHSYPNPGFSAPPGSARVGIYSFFYEKQLADSLAEKNLPVFITETGWSSESISEETQSQYYETAFNNYWNNSDIIAVTPFLFLAGKGPFEQFAFVKNNQKTRIYYTYKNFPKIKGEPVLSKENEDKRNFNYTYTIKKFNSSETINSVFKQINASAKTFFKWFLGV